MQYHVQAFPASFPYVILADMDAVGREVCLECLQVGLAPWQRVSNAVELFQDAVLHLCRGLVGEGHGQGAQVLGRVGGDEQSDVLYGQREGLSAAG